MAVRIRSALATLDALSIGICACHDIHPAHTVPARHVSLHPWRRAWGQVRVRMTLACRMRQRWERVWSSARMSVSLDSV